jgi:hypothetical protein
VSALSIQLPDVLLSSRALILILLRENKTQIKDMTNGRTKQLLEEFDF